MDAPQEALYSKNSNNFRFTKAPNVFLDELMPQIDSLAELKVTFAVMRQTIGFNRSEDRLSISRLEGLTGLSRESVVEGTRRALARGTIARRRSGGSFLYRFVGVREPDQQLVEKPDQSENSTGDGRKARPEVVGKLDTQKIRVKEEGNISTPSEVNTSSGAVSFANGESAEVEEVVGRDSEVLNTPLSVPGVGDIRPSETQSTNGSVNGHHPPPQPEPPPKKAGDYFALLIERLAEQGTPVDAQDRARVPKNMSECIIKYHATHREMVRVVSYMASAYAIGNDGISPQKALRKIRGAADLRASPDNPATPRVGVDAIAADPDLASYARVCVGFDFSDPLAEVPLQVLKKLGGSVVARRLTEWASSSRKGRGRQDVTARRLSQDNR